MGRSSSHPRSRQARRATTVRHGHVAREYERGHAAPFSPESAEVSQRDSPAMQEALGRDLQDGLTARRRKERAGAKQREGRSHLRAERKLH